MREEGGRLVLMDFGAGADTARGAAAPAGDSRERRCTSRQKCCAAAKRTRALGHLQPRRAAVPPGHRRRIRWKAPARPRLEAARARDGPQKRLRDARPDTCGALRPGRSSRACGRSAGPVSQRRRIRGGAHDALPRTSRLRATFVAAAIVGAVLLTGVVWFAGSRHGTAPSAVLAPAPEAVVPPVSASPPPTGLTPGCTAPVTAGTSGSPRARG